VIAMTERDQHEAERRLTRRSVIATGAAAYAGSMLWGTAAFAAGNPSRLLEALRQEISDSEVDAKLKSRLLKLTGDAKADLKDGSNVSARHTLQKKVIPLLQDSSGQHGLSAKQSKAWVAEAKKVVSKIPPDDGVQGPNGGSVYVFNCYNEPISGLVVGGGRVGNIPGWASGGSTIYTPSAIRVPRSKSAAPGNFATGDNSVRSPWDSYTGTTKITIPGPGSISLDDDLILFLAVNQATLMTTRVFVNATFPVDQQ
jgi:hypothetical protein